jgi:ribosomal protein S18 acetylase RimI-like enzyme
MSRGAKTAYLQVDAVNVPARALYDRMGFIDAYAYHYRTTHPTAA